MKPPPAGRYLPNVRCPSCHRAPNIRVYAGERERYDELDANQAVLNYRCHWRGCGEKYDITAWAFQHARPDAA